MANESVAVSGPTTGDAGDKADSALSKAIDSAFESVAVSDDKFAMAAKPASKTTEKPIDKTVTENAAPEESGDEAETADDGKPDDDKSPAPAVPAMSPPAHWDAAKRDAFGKLPPEAQKVVLDLSKQLEAGFTKQSQANAEDRQFAQNVKALITDGHREQLRREGMTEVDGIRHLLRLQDAYTRDAPGYVRFVVESSGLDPRQIWPHLFTGGEQQPQQPGQQPAPQAVDPQTQQLFAALQRLSGEVDGFKREKAEAQTRRATQAIESCRTAKDESGNLMFPHFDKVQNQMEWILTSNREILAIDDFGERLKKAYDLAVYADPEIRPQILDSVVQQRLADDRKKADLAKAKRAQAPIKGPTPATNTAKPSSLEEATRQAARQLGVA